MHSLTMMLAPTLLLPHFINAATLSASSLTSNTKDCHGKICHAVDEFCSTFLESCDQCANICDPVSHNYHVDTCVRQCSEYYKIDPLKAEIHAIQTQQHLILILLVVLLALIAIRYAYKCLRWMRHKRCITQMLKRLRPKKLHAMQAGNGKDPNGVGAGAAGDGGAMTIRNVMTVNEIERAPSQIYSVTGAEGSVMTMTTPVSVRYPAENSTSTTPSTVPGEYTYDNQAMALTPVSETPRGTQVF